MDTAGYLDKLKKGSKRGPHNKEQALADQIWTYFEKRLHFARIMKMIKEKGYRATYEVFNDVRQSDAENHLTLFIWRMKKEKVVWDEKVV